MITILLVLLLLVIVIFFSVILYNNNNNQKEKKRRSRSQWFGGKAGEVRLIRPPPPCFAANPLETPCQADDPLANFPDAVLYVPPDTKRIDVAVVCGKQVYACGSILAPTTEIVQIPLSLGDPIPIHASQLDVEYVARIDQEPELRQPRSFVIVSNSRSNKPGGVEEGEKKEEERDGQIHHWVVSDADRMPLLTETFLDVNGRCIQTLDEGGQRVTPVAGCLDKLTVYLPPHYRDQVTVRMYVNSLPCPELHVSCMHQTTQSGDSVRKLEAGDRFGIQLQNAAGNFGHVAVSVRFRERKN